MTRPSSPLSLAPEPPASHPEPRPGASATAVGSRGERGIDRGGAARSVLWSTAENGGLALISFAALIIYSRFLSAADFGVFSIALAIVELFGLLVTMLFHDALVQRSEVTALHFDTAFTVSMGLGLVLFGACALFAHAFATLLGDGTAAGVLAWTALCFPFTALSSTLVARHRRELTFRTLAVRSLAGRVLGAAVGITLVLCGAGVWGLVAQQVLMALVSSLVLWWASETRPRLRLGRRELRELWSFGAYAIGGLFLAFAVKRAFVVVAGVLLGSELAGYLNIGFRAVDVLWAIAATSVTQVALPVLSRLQSNPARLAATFREASGFACLVLYPCFVGLALVAPEAVELLFGRQWLRASPYVTVLGLLVLSQAPRLLVRPTLNAVGRPHDYLVGIGTELAVTLGLTFLLAPRTLAAAALVWVGRELVGGPVSFFVLGRATGFRARDELGGAARPLLATAVMALAVCGVRALLPPWLSALARLCVLVPVGASVFALAAWTFGAGSVRRCFEFLRAARVRPAA